MNNYCIIYLGALPNYDKILKNIFSFKYMNVRQFLIHPFNDCFSSISGLINFFNNINSIFPNAIKFKSQKKLYRLFIVTEISNKYIITKNFKFKYELLNNERQYNIFKNNVNHFVNFIMNHKDNYKFIFVRVIENDLEKNYFE